MLGRKGFDKWGEIIDKLFFQGVDHLSRNIYYFVIFSFNLPTNMIEVENEGIVAEFNPIFYIKVPEGFGSRYNDITFPDPNS